MFQKVMIIGNLGRDPEMRYMADGTAVTNFSVAVSKKRTDKTTGQVTEKTIWFRVAVWGKQAEPCNQYLAKGRKVYVEGELKDASESLFTRQDGTVGVNLEITAHNVIFLSSKDEGNGQSAGANTGGFRPGTPAAMEDDSDIPF